MSHCLVHAVLKLREAFEASCIEAPISIELPSPSFEALRAELCELFPAFMPPTRYTDGEQITALGIKFTRCRRSLVERRVERFIDPPLLTPGSDGPAPWQA